MAEQEEIDKLQMLVGDEFFDNDKFSAVLDMFNGSINRSASAVWQIRAGKYHSLVNVSESSSSRNLGDLHKNALAMADYYTKLAVAEEVVDEPETEKGRSGTRRIVRA